MAGLGCAHQPCPRMRPLPARSNRDLYLITEEEQALVTATCSGAPSCKSEANMDYSVSRAAWSRSMPRSSLRLAYGLPCTCAAAGETTLRASLVRPPLVCRAAGRRPDDARGPEPALQHDHAAPVLPGLPEERGLWRLHLCPGLRRPLVLLPEGGGLFSALNNAAGAAACTRGLLWRPARLKHLRYAANGSSPADWRPLPALPAGPKRQLHQDAQGGAHLRGGV